MWTRIAKHEWKTLVADKTLLVVALLLVGVIGYAALAGVVWARRAWDDARDAAHGIDRRIHMLRGALEPAAVGSARGHGAAGGQAPAPAPVDPMDAAAVGALPVEVVLPPLATAALSIGQGDLLPGRVSVSLWASRRTLTRNHEAGNPVSLMTGRFDVAFAVVYLFPLFVLALTYDLVSAERERGTLWMVLSQPVSLRTLVLGKVTLRFVLLAAVGVLLPLAALLPAARELAEVGVLVRLLLWAVVVCLYVAFWFALAIAVNALGKSSSTNAVLLAGTWLLLVLVLPAFANLAVSTIYPMPSRLVLVTTMREAASEAAEEGSRLLGKYYEDHPDLAAAGSTPDLGDFTMRALAVDHEVDRRVAPVLDRFDAQLAHQQEVVDLVRLLSPAIAAQEALDEIAGTSLVRYRRFRVEAVRYVDAWKTFFESRIVRKSKLAEADYDALPRFLWREEPATRTVTRVLVGLAGVAVLTAGLAAAGFHALRRYAVRD